MTWATPVLAGIGFLTRGVARHLIPDAASGWVRTIRVEGWERVTGRHVAARPPSQVGLKALSAMGAVMVTASMCGAAPTAPVQAAPFPEPDTMTLPLQQLRIDPATPVETVSRDTVSATSQAQLDAARAAAAAAAARAAAAQAAALQQAAAAREEEDGIDLSPGTAASLTFAAPAASRSGAAIVAYAQQYVGVVSYSTGATPAAGFECDGLVQWVFGAFGVRLPRGVAAQTARGVQITRGEAQAGDLVVYPGEHIGIYDGAGGIIDSPDWGRKVSHRPVWGSPIYIHMP